MNKRGRREWEHRDVLKKAGWSVKKRDSVAFNGGATESIRHFLCKAIVAYVLKQDGYRVASEVEGPGGEIDIIAYGTDDDPLAIEVETDVSDDVVQDKLERYVSGEPFRDLFVIPADELPNRMDRAVRWVRGQL